MARNNNKMVKHKKHRSTPAPLKMNFELGDGGTCYIDLSLAASILNRRAYRQGMEWAIAGITVYNGGNTNTVRVATLQHNWCTANAWRQGFELWNKMNDQVLDDEPTVQGKYHDFKIFMNPGHFGSYQGSGLQTDITDSANKTLLPVVMVTASGASQLPSVDNLEWNYSDYVFPDPDSGVATVANIAMNGATALTIQNPPLPDQLCGLISGYALSRERPQIEDPNVPLTSDDSWVNNLFDLGGVDTELRDIIVSENDRAPYALKDSASAQERYPGGETNLSGLELQSPPVSVSASDVYSGRLRLPGFTAPCGLIYLKNDGPVTIQLELVQGPYKGYMARPMQDM